jgi:glycosyltransferase involved in cell wall biosynthesis
MRIAMVGTRGVPATYGGFETAVEEIGSRLAADGHEIVVYCRGSDRSAEYKGMRRVVLPALPHPGMETLSHSAASVLHVLAHRADVVLMFNPGNSPLLPLLRAARIPVAVHMDGMDWKRAKWGPLGRRYLKASVRVAISLADAIIADSRAIQDFYRGHFRVESTFLPYGADIVTNVDAARLRRLGMEPRGFHLAVARMEPENNVELIVNAYRAANTRYPLVVVGGKPYPSAYSARVRTLAAADPRIRMLGAVWDQDLLNALYAGCITYVHGHSVGGTNPSLLRAMGAGADVVAWNVRFNQEVLADTGRYFGDQQELTGHLADDAGTATASRDRGTRARDRVARQYRWNEVAQGYEALCADLVAGRYRDRAALPRTGSRTGAGHGCAR